MCEFSNKYVYLYLSVSIYLYVDIIYISIHTHTFIYAIYFFKPLTLSLYVTVRGVCVGLLFIFSLLFKAA